MSLFDLLLMVFPALMAYAAVSDLLTMTIPNRIAIALAALFFVLAPSAGLGWLEIGWHAAVAAAVLAVGIAAFACGCMGGGDAKLMAATALWFGPTPILWSYLFLAAVLGSVLAGVILVTRRWPGAARGAWRRLPFIADPSAGVPYALALSAAALLLFRQSPVWVALA